MDVLLSPAARELLDAERALLRDLLALLDRLEADHARRNRLKDLIDHLEALFLVVVVGEFNAGKSSLLNALFGEKVVEEGPIPTTAKITLLRYGAEPMVRQLTEYVLEQRYPADLLRNLTLVDTPGTNSIVRRHQEITEDFIPRADLVVFVTSFDRPLTESERQFMSFVRDVWGRRLVFVLNKVDLAEGRPEALEQVLTYLKTSTQELMGFVPQVFAVSSELAFRAATTPDPDERAALLARSRFDVFERFLRETLAGPEQVALKLSAPLDTADRMIGSLDAVLAERRAALEADEAQLREIEDHFAQAHARLREQYRRYLVEVDNLLLQMERRGVQFLEDNIRVGRLRLLRDRDAFKEEFSRQVIRQNERDLEDRLTEAVDVLLREGLSLWNWTLGRFNTRLRDRPEAPGAGAFAYNRAEVFDNVRRQAERRIAAYDLNEEARRILENARSAAALFLGAEGIAAGIGAVATVVIATTAVDVTGGFVAAGVLAAFGFIFLPRQKRKAVQEFRSRVENLRADLERALTEQFDREIDETLQRARELVAPYVRFVEDERETMAETTASRDAVRAGAERLRARVEATFGPARVGD